MRDRYGEEIAEMLADSPRPVRDLADVAWCALADRRENFAVPRLRVRDLGLVTMLAAPIAFTAAYFAVLLAITILLNTRHEIVQLITNVIMLAPMAFLAFVWGRQLRPTRPIAVFNVVVPAALAIVFLSLIMIAPDHQFYGLVEGRGGSEWVPDTLAAVSWCAGLIVLALATASLRKREHYRIAIIVGVVGAFAVMELSTVVHVLSLLNGQEAPREYALLWYPAAISGGDFGLGRPGAALGGAVGSVSVVLTVCTVFALALTGLAGRGELAAGLRHRQ
ncbi:hypothetical protein ACLQ28_19855 [Micromonospora sp. DT201]|uniref:hypothetical protein n=1 Tax=Micromonospora sp. DT201 TaxID=3393442 RepID=UPI003CF6CA76